MDEPSDYDISNHPTFVRTVRLFFDNENDFIIEINTYGWQYIFIIVLEDNRKLNAQEAEAVADCISYARPHRAFRKDDYSFAVEELRDKYNVQGPNVQSRSIAVAVKPGCRTFNTDSDDTLLHTLMTYDVNGNFFFFNSFTKKETTFAFVLNLTIPRGCLTGHECQIFREILLILRPGNVLGDAQFREHLSQMKKSGVYLLLRRIQQSTSGFPGLGVRIGRPNRSPITSFSTESTSSSLPSSLTTDIERSPYNGIVYKKALKRSGQAQVYLAERDGQKVAVKVFLDGEGQIDTYKSELRMLLKTPKHPNVVQVIDFFESPKPALVMEYIEGQDLSDFLKRNGPFSQKEGLKICTGIASGLCHLHDNNIIHRDLKSANILRRADGTPVIIDLGLSSVLSNKEKNKQIVGNSQHDRIPSTIPEIQRLSLHSYQIFQETLGLCGTLLWLSPEMITSNRWNDRTDVYAFAVIMWEIFSGRYPFSSEIHDEMNPMNLMFQIVEGRRPSIIEISNIEPSIRRLIQDCWQHDPNNRPSMKKVLLQLRMHNPEALFNEADKDNSKDLSFTEFVVFLDSFAPGKIPPGNTYDLFKKCDLDGTESLSFRDFKVALEELSRQ